MVTIHESVKKGQSKISWGQYAYELGEKIIVHKNHKDCGLNLNLKKLNLH